jgi:proteasome lid subunit RPN8/RPN11
MAFRIARNVLDAIRAHARETYPDECCGALLRGPNEPVRVRRCRNVQNELHASDPGQHPRDARTAYHIDPRELLAITREADAEGGAIAAFYHSHPDHGAYFSAEDRARAVAEEWNEPLYPDAVYLVLAVRNGKAGEMKAFVWDDDAREYVETPIEETTA